MWSRQRPAVLPSRFDAKLKEAAVELDDLFSKYRISEALMVVYKLFWDEFSSWYLEMVKPAYVDGKQQPIDRETYDATLRFFDVLLKMLHPSCRSLPRNSGRHSVSVSRVRASCAKSCS